MRRKAMWLALLVLLAGFALNNLSQPAMAITYCDIYCPSHQCSGTCYCRALQTASSCSLCPDICWHESGTEPEEFSLATIAEPQGKESLQCGEGETVAQEWPWVVER